MANELQRIGPHRLLAGDIHTSVVEAAMAGDLADVIYTDPPWGPGLLQMFATMHIPGSAPICDWHSFLATLCGACATYRAPMAPVFVEMGLRWVDELDESMAVVGLPRQRRWAVTYGSKRSPLPSTLNLYGPRDVNVQLPAPPHGEPVTRAALTAVVRPGAIVLDPCTGLGMTARFAHRLGGHFRGTELNPERLERTAAWLRAKFH